MDAADETQKNKVDTQKSRKAEEQINNTAVGGWTPSWLQQSLSPRPRSLLSHLVTGQIDRRSGDSELLRCKDQPAKPLPV